MSCGKEHLIALTEDGCVLTMGTSTRGQLGFGSTSSSDCLRQLDILEPLRFVKVAAGGWHSLVLAGERIHLKRRNFRGLGCQPQNKISEIFL